MQSMVNERATHIVRMLLTLVLAICVAFAAITAIRGNILFHTDIARDLLLIEDIVENQKLTLLGPRAGGIPGVFHGPLWLYINLPFYLLGNGDPSIIGMGWFVLWMVSLCFVWYASLRITSESFIALAVVTWYALLTFSWTINYLNPSGAYLVVPLWFASLVMYHRFTRLRYIISSYFLLGIIIQFQMALGAPLAVLTTFLLIEKIVRHKKWLHIASVFAITPFLLTFIVFELRHDFLQTNSTIRYVFGEVTHGKSTEPLASFMRERLVSSGRELIQMLARGALTYSVILILIGFALGRHSIQISSRKINIKDLLPDYVWFALYVWVGYWIVTLPYKGVMWGYYFGPLLPVVVIGFVGFLMHVFRTRAVFIVAICILLMFPFGWLTSIWKPQLVASMSMGDWAFVEYKLEQTLFASDAPKEFGYYVFTRDQLGYSQLYALQYLGRKHQGYTLHPLTKQKVTYLLVETEPHHVANSDYWRKEQVGISRPPDKVYNISKYFQIERYDLSEDEMKVSSDPHLNQNLIFR